MTSRSSMNFLPATLGEFMSVWSMGGNSSLHLTTSSGHVNVGFNLQLGHPDSPLPSHTTIPSPPSHPPPPYHPSPFPPAPPPWPCTEGEEPPASPGCPSPHSPGWSPFNTNSGFHCTRDFYLPSSVVSTHDIINGHSISSGGH